MDILPELTLFIEENIYKNTIDKYFRNLNIEDKNILKKYYKKLLIVIYYAFFNINTNLEIFKQKLLQNNYADATAIMYLLLPYINHEDDTNTIISFNDFVKRKKYDINIKTESPKYSFTNFQYNRCNRSSITEINFNEDFLKNNLLFIVDTIKKSSNKLYINWFDIIPYSIKKYKESKLYQNTIALYYSNNLRHYNFLNPDFKIDNNLITNLQVLGINDIYETITNEFYYSVKNIKWLIYDVIIKNRPVPLIVALDEIFRHNIIIDTDLTVDRLNKQINVFKGKWEELLNASKTKSDFNNGLVIISFRDVIKIVKAIAIFFNNYYKDIEKLIERKKYIPLNFSDSLGTDDDIIYDNTLDDNEEEGLSKVNFSKIYKTISKVDIQDIYTFIQDSLELFKLTWYSKIILKESEDGIISENEFSKKMPYVTGQKITLKNIYNFAKSFCHINYNGVFTPLPKFWQSLTNTQRTIIEDRLYDKSLDVMSWFNISRNLNNLFSNQPRMHIVDMRQYHIDINNHIRANLIDYVFESLIYRGVLSKLVPSLELTDTCVIPLDQRNKLVPPKLKETVFKRDDSNDIYTDSYYYLTSCKYKNIKDMVLLNDNKEIDKQIDKEIDKNKLVHYFDYNSSSYGRGWYITGYTIYWIPQIDFFNKFINNRIIYATGATGVGKSTLIPKLFLYAGKAILYNSQNRVACSQPRKTPTEKNAFVVSSTLGVKLDKEKNRNYYVQFKHKDDSHIKNINGLSLKFITDGTLKLEIKNPVLKKEPHFVNNLYDIIIVDEAHEHNDNMDTILTLMKYCALYNNTIKLVIVSATMDDDEPIYRRFYRDVNDNKMYPLNYGLLENQLDRINVDRRLHIGTGTRFKIIEKYIDSIKPELQKSYKLAIDIINKSTDGFILIFQPTQKCIEETIYELNKPGVLPDNVIAIPYYSKLTRTNREFIENIDDNLEYLNIKKEDNFNSVNRTRSDTIGPYNRCIIVATNIAEASITINRLKYVIDTGTQVNVTYDFLRRTNQVDVKGIISDSSRLQRKGRVGRTSSGEVFYLYEKNKTENIKNVYGICAKDIGLEIFRFLYENSDEQILLSSKNDPNNPKIKLEYDTLVNIYGIFHNNFKTYFNIDEYFSYFGNTSHYDYENYENDSYYHEKGYSLYNLNDYSGKFYVIHPEEIYLKRNILGEIISTCSKYIKLDYSKKIISESQKLVSMWDTLVNTYFLTQEDSRIVKSNIGGKFQKLQEIFSFDDTDMFKVFMYSFVFGIEEEFIRIYSILESMGSFTDELLKTYMMGGKKFRAIGEAIKIVGSNCRGDFEALLTLLDLFHNGLNTLGVIYDKDLDFTSEIHKTTISKFLFSLDTYKRFATSFSMGLSDRDYNYLSRDDYLKIRKSGKIYEYIQASFDTNRSKIIKLCNSLQLNYQTMKKYFGIYSNLKNKLYLYRNKYLDDNIKLSEYNLLDELKEILTKTIINQPRDNYEKLLLSFIMAKSYNIVSRITGTNKYVFMYDPDSANIYTLKTISKIQEDTFVNPMYLTKYLYYVNLNLEFGTLSLVNYIHPLLFENLYKIYNLHTLGKKIMTLTNSTITIASSDKYKKQLLELDTDLELNTRVLKTETSTIARAELFNKKIRELMI